MSTFSVFLFGRFSVKCDEQVSVNVVGQKVQELFCYLMLHRNQPQVREKLASLLWPGSQTSQMRQYLRRSLWQLQAMLEEVNDSVGQLIDVESDWVQINPTASYWCDVNQFTAAYSQVQGVSGRDLDQEQAEILNRAVELYRGDLLENWYQEWCILERERLQNLYLVMLDKLMSYCELQGAYEQGAIYGSQILRCDIARERTYRNMMRLLYLAGDRTGALRLYERCVVLLARELDVKPARQTVLVYEQIKDDQLLPLEAHPPQENATRATFMSASGILDHLDHIRMALINAQRQVEEEMAIVRASLIERR